MSQVRNDEKRIYYGKKRHWEMAWTRVLVRMATCDGRYPLSRVEMAPRFEMAGTGATVMDRHQVFQSTHELLEYTRARMPDTMQFGGIMPGLPPASAASRRPQETLTQVGRHRDGTLVKGAGVDAYFYFMLDIDLKDYDRSNVCRCTSHECCGLCWACFVEPARAVTEYLLGEVYGLRGLLAVYSGGRGFHQWVLDPRTFHWSNDERVAVMARLTHPLRHDAHTQHIYRNVLLPAYRQRPALRERDESCSYDAVMSALWPRYDVDVSTKAYHLKKCPFAIHQTRLFLCFPLPPLGVRPLFNPLEDSVRPTHMSLGDWEQFLDYAVRKLDECRPAPYDPAGDLRRLQLRGSTCDNIIVLDDDDDDDNGDTTPILITDERE